MLAHYALTLYRSLTRHKLYAAINVLGLAVGIAVFLVLALDVRFETSFERWIPDAAKIYIVRQTWAFPGRPRQTYPYTMGGLLDELKEDFGPGVTGTRIWSRSANVQQRGEARPEEVEVVDRTFFDVFPLPLREGDRRTALASPDGVVLSAGAASRYFGAAPALGQTLSLTVDGMPRTARVTGVLREAPAQTDLKLRVLMPLSPEMTTPAVEPSFRHWGSSSLATYLRFDRPEQAQALNARLPGFIDRRAAPDMRQPDAHKVLSLSAAPLTSQHLFRPADRAVVAVMGVVGALTLLLAVINYVNLATARAGLRAREAAVRKVMGATGGALVAQFMAEAVVVVSLAALVGLAITELTLPLINAAGGLSLRLGYLGPDSVLPFVLGLVLVVGLGAGVWPALVLSRFRPAAVLASARTPGGGRAGSRVRGVLVGAQFAVAITFGVCTSVILTQGRHLRAADLGFRRDGLIIVKSLEDPDLSAAQRSALLEAWRRVPGVAAVTFADIAPGVDESTSADTVKRPGVSGEGPSLIWVSTGPDFFRVYGARLLAGRFLDTAHAEDDAPQVPEGATPAQRAAAKDRNRNIVLNAAALPVVGFRSAKEAVGQVLLSERDEGGYRPMRVVGVVSDFRLRTPREPVPATYYVMRSRGFDNGVAALRYAGAEPSVMISRLQGAWRRIAPTVPFEAHTGEQKLGVYYRSDDERGRLFTIGALLAVAIGCVGLYGLASFNTARRVKEIGIRKTLGASTRDILVLLLSQFVTPVLWANLAAWPLAYVAMRAWLSGFDQRIALGPQYFLGASVVALAVATLTVTGQALRVARAEPARALRHE